MTANHRILQSVRFGCLNVVVGNQLANLAILFCTVVIDGPTLLRAGQLAPRKAKVGKPSGVINGYKTIE